MNWQTGYNFGATLKLIPYWKTVLCRDCNAVVLAHSSYKHHYKSTDLLGTSCFAQDIRQFATLDRFSNSFCCRKHQKHLLLYGQQKGQTSILAQACPSLTLGSKRALKQNSRITAFPFFSIWMPLRTNKLAENPCALGTTYKWETMLVLNQFWSPTERQFSVDIAMLWLLLLVAINTKQIASLQIYLDPPGLNWVSASFKCPSMFSNFFYCQKKQKCLLLYGQQKKRTSKLAEVPCALF